MKTFKDKEGTSWTLDLNLGAAMKIESYDVAEAVGKESPYHLKFLDSDDAAFQLYLTNTKVCFTIIWCCCEKQAKSRDITDEIEFASRFDGETWDLARMAMMEELINFFPRKAITLRALIQKYCEVMATQDRVMGEAIQKHISAENLQKLEAQVMEDVERGIGEIMHGGE